MLGTIIILVIAFFVFLGLIAGLVSMTEKEVTTVKDGTILKMELDYMVHDRAPKDPMSMMNFSFEFKENLGMNDIIKNVEKAKKDAKIKGIFLDLSIVPSGISIMEEIRDALIDFKESGKFVYCYGEMYSQGAYYLGSCADKVFLHPDGLIEMRGISAEMFFLKGTLEKLDIDAQVIREGKYKSAIEIFTEDKMSEANREQMEAYINGAWQTYLSDISLSRNLPVEKLNTIADGLESFNAEKAKQLGLVDGLMHRDEVMSELKTLAGLQADSKVEFLSLEKYDLATDPEKKKVIKDKIAVIYALGSIEGGKGDDLTIGSEKLAATIEKARKDKKIKAIVMRVNSPGGSAMASEVIRREVDLAKKEKPFIVSMGDVAASGGYWISCTADRIIADPTTLTGSIGVFGIIPNMEDFFKNKLGVTFDYAKTNENADFPSFSKPMNEYQKAVMQKEIDLIYSKFLALVSTGRNMPVEKVNEIAQGRIWVGTDALKIGLVDELGGLDRAIDVAAEIAGLEEYAITSLPFQKEPLQQLIDDLTGNNDTRIRNELGSYYTYYEFLKSIEDMDPIQARLPFEMQIR